jgi:hypothetical protein
MVDVESYLRCRTWITALALMNGGEIDRLIANYEYDNRTWAGVLGGDGNGISDAAGVRSSSTERRR